MKPKIGLLLSYMLVLALLGIGMLQYFLIKQQKELVTEQILHSLKRSLGEVEWKIKIKELSKLVPELDSLGIYNPSKTQIQFKNNPYLNTIIDTCKDSFEDDFSLFYDSILPPYGEKLLGKSGQSLIHKLLVESYYLSLKNFLENKSISQRISAKELREILDEEFQKNDIRIPYEFAIYHNGSETRLRSPYFKKDRDHLVIPYKLFTGVPGRDQYTLYISVKKSEIFKGNLLIFKVLSILFTTILLLSFLFTMYNMMRQRHLNELKNDFINNITHEFKTPIATMSIAIDSMKSPHILKDPEKIKFYLKILKRENQRMLDQVEKILFLSKLEQGMVLMQEDIVDVHEIIQDALDHMKLILQDKDAEINLELKAENPFIKGDAVFLFDALINLLDNAVKYSHDKKVVIHIKTYNDNGHLVIEISDQGVGMSQEVVDQIFDKFYRKPTGDIHNIPGHGIGLTFVKQIIDKFKGQIKVKSEVGRGTTFILIFPTISPDEYLKNSNHKS
ncbi:MAG: HAMP domain-containing histidine kinase [Chlorobi bacterium]|nr:HAMP domain-containing histidine kinase [Chlorobiota bacterium]